MRLSAPTGCVCMVFRFASSCFASVHTTRAWLHMYVASFSFCTFARAPAVLESSHRLARLDASRFPNQAGHLVGERRAHRGIEGRTPIPRRAVAEGAEQGARLLRRTGAGQGAGKGMGGARRLHHHTPAEIRCVFMWCAHSTHHVFVLSGGLI